jgi:MoaA/NifB/PqqE/SkfB family radical SAM enzyme
VNHVIQKLPVLVIYAHSRCNCRCVMCDIWKAPVQVAHNAAERELLVQPGSEPGAVRSGHREFTLEQLQAQMGALERLQVEWVVFSGGEPLMHSDLFALTRLLRTHGIRVTILSTGLLFERCAKQIAAETDDAIVSLDGPEEVHDRIRRVPGSFRAIREGVAAIHRIKPEFPVAARSTVQKANHAALTETVEAARDMGLKSISFLAVDITSAAFGRSGPVAAPDGLALSEGEITVLEHQIDAVMRDSFVIDRPEHLRRIVRHFRAHLGLEDFAAPRCNAPWVSAVMETGGGVRPCFFHPVVARTGEVDLDAALNQHAAHKFRESLNIAENETCRRCTCSLYLPPGV